MNHCATCKHFITDKLKVSTDAKTDLTQYTPWSEEAGYGIVKEMVPGWGQCGRIPMNRYRTESDKAVAVDGDDYYAGLVCKSDFGCVQHEEKIEPTDPLVGHLFNAVTACAPSGLLFSQRQTMAKALCKAYYELYDRVKRT